MLRHFVLVGCCLLVAIGMARAEDEHWKKLDGPYWVNGIDVAYGTSGEDRDWHRYLIGSGENETKLFKWNSDDEMWSSPPLEPYPGANKVVTYKWNDGHYAVFSAYNDDIYVSANGGVEWRTATFPDAFNQRFSGVDIREHETPGQTIVVSSSLQLGLASAYYSANGGRDWAKLGDPAGDPLDELEVYDIETAELSGHTAGTSDGLYFHLAAGSWTDPWELVAFDNCHVVALDNVDLYEDQQVAAVVKEDFRKLCYTRHLWSDYSEILIDEHSFDKEVTDIAAIYLSDGIISCYVATTDGVYLVQFLSTNPAGAFMRDIKAECTPMQYDRLTNAVDYRLYDDGQYKYTSVLAATRNNVYEIITKYEWDGTVVDIDVTEIVTGTFLIKNSSTSSPE